MHACSVCSRNFSTKSSLNRHEQNHRRTRHFTCSVCQVSFRRHDLLTRHARIHEEYDADEVSEQRRRSRTACDQCRSARVKCSGQLPCGRCQERNANCSFAQTGMRTSINHRVAAPGLPSPSSAIVNENINNEADYGQASVSVMLSEHAPLSQPSGGISQSDMAILPVDLSPDTTAWPWLHESLFLQDDLNLDWFDVSAGASQHQTVVHSDLQTHDEGVAGISAYSVVEDREDPDQSVASEHGDWQEDLGLAAVEALVSAASVSVKGNASRGQLEHHESSFYNLLPTMSAQVETVFNCPPHDNAETFAQHSNHTLHLFLQLYEKYFWPLWPFTPRHRFSNHKFDPLLYLAMISIGAMYGGRQASVFGIALHVCLRDELINPLLDINMPRKAMLSLGQARALTQAAALYFGQKRAFSYAQHLGGALVAQARKMSLFSGLSDGMLSRTDDTFVFVDTWINQECRKRLAFAMLRLEMYTSVLHSTRPLVTGEEMDIDLPCSHELWSTSFRSDEAFAAAIQQESTANSLQVSYSDLVRIASDPAERLPHLNMLHLELLMNAMQEQIWLSCVARDSLDRLSSQAFFGSELVIDTGHIAHIVTAPPYVTTDTTEFPDGTMHVQSLDAHLAWGSRNMGTLRTRLRSTTSALSKLRNEVLDVTRIRSSGSGMSQADRSRLLSCLLVFHLGFLQLNAPLRSIHQVCHSQRTVDTTKPDANATRVKRWVTSKNASVATRHAINIYNLLRAETEKQKDCRANVNFLTMIGLYHSAALVWTYATLMRNTDAQQPASEIHNRPRLYEGKSTSDMPSMAEFEKVLHDINPAWAGRSSFSAAISKLRLSVSLFG